jgi:hypothetical protein
MKIILNMRLGLRWYADGPDLSRETPQLLFDEAAAGDDSLRGALAAFLHKKHPKTAHPLK